MAGIELADAQTALAAAIAAHAKAVESQSYSIEGRSLSRPNFDALLKAIDYWDNKVQELSQDQTGLIVSQFSPEYDY